MAQENTQTVSQEQPTSTQQQGGESKTETLEQVYSKFNVEAEASNFQPQRQEQTQQVQQPVKEIAVPDPVLDPQAYKTWAGQQSQFVQQALSQIQGQLNQVQVERLRTREEADVKSSVHKFKSIAGEDVDDDMVEVALGMKARKDPKFLTVYQNRSKNPQAWQAAVSAYANEFKAKNSYKIDPQIAENQRAAKTSIQGSQARQKEETSGVEKQFEGKTGGDFNQAWRRYVDSSNF